MEKKRSNRGKVLVIMGSKSDLPVVESAIPLLKELGLDFEVRIASAHRTPELVREIVSSTDADVIIAVAGMSAHLPGVVASLTDKPVLGVPVNSGHYSGVDSLLSMVEMPPGVPVATFGQGKSGMKNAVIFSAKMLGLKYDYIVENLKSYIKSMKDKVFEDDADVQERLK